MRGSWQIPLRHSVHAIAYRMDPAAVLQTYCTQHPRPPMHRTQPHHTNDSPITIALGGPGQSSRCRFLKQGDEETIRAGGLLVQAAARARQKTLQERQGLRG
jgi:hypothetical protein